MKKFKVFYRSRYYPMEGEYCIPVKAPSTSWIRHEWHSIIHTDEYRIIRCEEIKMEAEK